MKEEELVKNISSVLERINRACERAKRDPRSVKLVAVTKTVSPEIIEVSLHHGITDIGENRVQEAKEKYKKLSDYPIKWHMIGYLQRNKVRDAVKLFDFIHSVDRIELVDVLEKELAKIDKKMPSLIEVNVAKEVTKHGVYEENLEAFLEYIINNSKMIKPIGLMTVAPYVEDANDVRWVFRRLRELRDKIREKYKLDDFCELSMGMSNDFEVAIEEGATIVRIGTLIFGERR
ncbi:MAG: YggS family pyridoxal phosphate-dependent enzyme [Thermosulfidibacteraceae bacterium]